MQTENKDVHKLCLRSLVYFGEHRNAVLKSPGGPPHDLVIFSTKIHKMSKVT